jgi:hypothetical protein
MKRMIQKFKSYEFGVKSCHKNVVAPKKCTAKSQISVRINAWWWNLFKKCENLFCKGKTYATKAVAIVFLLLLNFGAFAQEPLDGGKIKIKEGYDTICAGEMPQTESVIDATGGVGRYFYTWEMRTDDDDKWIYVGSVIEDYSFISMIHIRRMVRDFIGNTAYSDTVTVAVNPRHELILPPTSLSICSGGEFNYTAESTVDGTTFTWSRKAVEGISQAASYDNSGATIKETLRNTTKEPIEVEYEFTLTANGCTNNDTLTLTVYPQPTLNLPSSLNVCSGSEFNYTPESTISGMEITCTRRIVQNITPIAYPLNSSGVAYIKETLTNSTQSPITVRYEFTFKVNGCTYTQYMTVTVNPKPVLSSSISEVICSGSTFNYAATSDAFRTAAPGTTSVSWGRAFVEGIIPATSNGNTAKIEDPLFNNTPNPIPVIYELLLVVNGCVNTQYVTVRVNRFAVSDDIHVDGKTEIYRGSKTELTAVSEIENATYRWYSSHDATDPFYTGKIFTTPVMTGDEVYYVGVAGEGVCENVLSRREVRITVSPAPAPSFAVQPADTAYSVCDESFSHRLVVTPETNDGDVKFYYQWYSATVPDTESGEAISGATDSIFITPAGLPTGTYYYYCKVKSDYSLEAYSRITEIRIEHGEAAIESLSVNYESISLQTDESKYSMPCGEEYIILSAVASSKYAHISVIVDGREYEYGKTPNNLQISLSGTVTEIVVRVVNCNGQNEHKLAVVRSVENLIYQRWDNSLAVYRNPDNNGGYTDIRGVRWYKNGELLETQTIADMSVPADIRAWERWFIHLDEGEPVEQYSAELNIAGIWRWVCGTPVKNVPVNKIIVYPNPVPVGENINIELPFASGCMDIISLSGSIIKRNIPLNSSKNYISVGDLSTGIYILRIVDTSDQLNQTIAIFKLIVGN